MLGAFKKTSPSNISTGQPVNVTLIWTASENGIKLTRTCVDTVSNTTCDTEWISVGNTTSADLTGLPYNKTHYWTVRSRNPGGTKLADSGCGGASPPWSCRR